MEKLDFDKVVEDMLYRSMINPNNKELYIKTMSPETLENLMKGDDDEKVAVVWRAIHRAIEFCVLQDYQENQEKEYYQDLQLEMDEIAKEGAYSYYGNPNACPNCSYEYARGYKVCPNCAHEMEEM